MNPTNSMSAAAIIYYRVDGQLHHWVISAHRVLDTVETLKCHLEKWIPGAEFIEGRIEKMNLVNRDTANYHEKLRWSEYLVRDAVRIETSDGHLMSCYDGVWYAYPCRAVPRPLGGGGEVIREGADRMCRPKEFRSAIEAYRACLEAAGYFDKIAEAERAHRELHEEVIECSAAL